MSAVGEAYVEIGAKLDKLAKAFQKAKAEAEAGTKDLGKTVETKSGFAGLAESFSRPIVQGVSTGLKFLADKGEAVLKKMSTGVQALAAGLVAFSAFGDFPHAKVFQRQLEAIRNELYVALLPAFKALLGPLEDMRVAIYRNRQLIAAFGTGIAKGLGSAIRYISGITQAFRGLSPATQASITQMLGIGTAVLLVGQRLSFAIPLVRGLSSALMMLNPVTAIIAAIGAGIAVLAAGGGASTFTEGLQNAFKNFAELAGEALPIVMDLLNNMFSLVKSGVSFIVGDWSNAWETIKAVVLGALEIVNGLFSNTELAVNAACTAIKLAFMEVLYFITITFPMMVIRGIAWLFMTVVNIVKDAFLYIVRAAVSAAQAIVEAFGEAWNMILRGDFSVANIASKIGEAFQRGMAAAASGARWFVNAEWRDSLRNELADQVAQLRRARESRQADSRNRPTQDTGEQAPPPIRNPKFETVGLTDLYKKVQENIAGTSLVSLEQRHLEVANQQHRELRTQTGVLTEIRNSVREAGPARAG